MADDLLDLWAQQPAPVPSLPVGAMPPAQSGAMGKNRDSLDAWAQGGDQTFTTAQPPIYLDDGRGGEVQAQPLSDQQLKEIRDTQKPLPIGNAPIQSWQDAKDAAAATLDYAKHQVAGVPAQISADYQAGMNLLGNGLADPNVLPSFPSTDPHTWGAGGLLKGALGVIGALSSPITSVSTKLVAEPVTQATGNPQAGDIAGGIAAAALSNILPAMMRAPPAYAETLRLAKVAEDAGIPIRAPQISTNPFIQKMDQVLGWQPGSGRSGEEATQQSAFNRAVAQSFGEDAPQVTRTTIANAQQRIGNVLDTVENRTPVNFNGDVINSLGNVEDAARNTFGVDNPQYNRIKNQIDQIVNVAAQHGGNVPGDVWAQFYHRGSPLDSLTNAQDPEIANLAGRLKSTMQDAIQSQATAEDAAAYTQARAQYRNMKTVEPLVTKGSPGDISPLGLAQQTNREFSTTRAGQLGDLADAARRFMRPPKDSGTPLGNALLDLLKAPGQMAGAALAGQHFGLSGPEFAGMVIAAPTVTSGVARLGSALLNNPMYKARLLAGGAAAPSMAQQLIYGAIPNIPKNFESYPLQLER
jgi:hypothetical protein